MDILFIASQPFEGLSRRPQLLARGLAARGHRVVYLEPPHPFGLQVDPSRFAPEAPGALPSRGESPEASRVPSPAARGGGAGASMPLQGLWLVPARAAIRPGRWGWDSRAGWKAWAAQVSSDLEAWLGGTLFGHQAPAASGGVSVPADLRPAVTLIDHPALLSIPRERIPGVLVFDGLEDLPARGRSRTLAAVYDEALAQGIPQVDGLMAVHRYALETWSRHLRPGADAEVIEQGVDLSLFRPADPASRARARARLGEPQERPLAAYLGSFDARISFEDLEHILETRPELGLLLLGEVGSEGASLLQRLPETRVRALGAVSQRDAAALLPAADLLLIPYRREPELEAVRGLKLYEYFATGLPVVASFRRGMKAFRDLLYLYTTWVELETALRDALAEAPGSESWTGRIAAARAAGWERRAEACEAFLQRVVAQGPRP